VALQRILNVPRRGIGDTTIERLVEAAAARDWTLAAAVDHADAIDLARPAARKVKEFGSLLGRLRAHAASATCVQVVQAVLEATRYFEYLRESDPATFDTRRENVEELVSAAQAFADESADDPSLRAFLEEISLLSDIDSMQEKIDTVTLMTLHSAKGLEFPVVLVTGLEEGLLPHASSLDTLAGLEEERRLFYVGMTRAEDRLYLLSASNRRRYGGYEPMMASRFLRELPESQVVLPAEAPAPRRATWAPRQPSWRSYAEGDPDSFAASVDRQAGLEPSRRSLGWAEDEGSQEHVTLEVGMRVRHEKFGDGMVQRIEGHGDMMKVTVVFGRQESRKFVARYARLVPLG